MLVPAGPPQDLGQPGPVGLAGDDLAGQGDVIQQVRQRAGRLREGALFLQDVPLDRDDLPGLLVLLACLPPFIPACSPRSTPPNPAWDEPRYTGVCRQ